MPITNRNTRVVDVPTWDIMQALPAASAAGTAFCNDQRGSDRYIYMMLSVASFWRYDVWANTYQQLTSPPGGTFGIATVMVYDPSGTGSVFALISSGVGAPTWQVYDVATNAWTVRSITNLPATFGTSASLLHTDTAYHASGNNDFIYLVGNNATTLYRFSISGNAWLATLLAVTAAPGAGCVFEWQPGYDPNKLLLVRGGATQTVYEYNISGNTWATVTVQPSTPETFTTGTFGCARNVNTAKVVMQKDAADKLYELTMTAPAVGTITPLATQYLVLHGAAIQASLLSYVASTDGVEFIYDGLHTSTFLLRTPLFF